MRLEYLHHLPNFDHYGTGIEDDGRLALVCQGRAEVGDNLSTICTQSTSSGCNGFEPDTSLNIGVRSSKNERLLAGTDTAAID